MAGDEVVLGFISPPKSSFHDPSPPIKELFKHSVIINDCS
jgi:hypothetical protein